MATFIDKPTIIAAAGNKPKVIEEYVGRANGASKALSIAKMRSPSGWVEPGQTPEFNEYTVVLHGELEVRTKVNTITVATGQAVMVPAGEWVQYATPGPDGAEYLAVCLPAFSAETVHRDEDSAV